ncbi:transcriptional regulator [Candidatus Bathyarchaeota archaeon]|nr:transcriptional regulator [Candidatus Bathyarchaeota archaeon]
MRPPCEIVARDILPAVRSLVAKDLIEHYGFTQTTVARKLGITQAAISYYRDSKRGSKSLKELEEDSLVRHSVNELAEGIAKDILSEDEITLRFCRLCENLRKHEQIERFRERLRISATLLEKKALAKHEL